MNTEKLLFAITDIDDRFIEAAENPQKKHSKKRTAAWLSLAACTVLIVAGIFIYAQPGKELPMLSISDFNSGGMGMEAYMAYSIDELINSAPITAESTPETLPVYLNTLYNSMSTGGYEHESADTEENKKLLLDAAEKLKMDTAELTPTYDSRINTLYVEDENYIVEIGFIQSIDITAKNKSALPEGYALDYYGSYDEYYKAAEYLKEKYSEFLGMKKPVINIYGGDYDIYGRRGLHLEIYDGAGTAAEQLNSFCFNKVRFYTDDEGLLHISESRYDLTQVIGVYPTISKDEALGMLLNGKYITSVFQEIQGEDRVKKVELVYHTSLLSQTFMPYYKFYVEIENTGDIAKTFPGMKTYGAYYVPAVESRYIENSPQWDGHIN